MSLQSRLASLISAIGADINALNDAIYTDASNTTFMASKRIEWEVVETSPGVYPARPVYAGPVRWKGTFEPESGGTTTSGTTAVAGLDYWRHIS